MNTLQDTIDWAQPFVEYTPLTAGEDDQPALSIANCIQSTILNPPFSWAFNRHTLTFPTVIGQQDYGVSVSDFGYIEKVTLTDDDGNVFELKDVMNTVVLGKSSQRQRPSAICVLDISGDLRVAQTGKNLVASAKSISLTLSNVKRGSALAVIVSSKFLTPPFAAAISATCHDNRGNIYSNTWGGGGAYGLWGGWITFNAAVGGGSTGDVTFTVPMLLDPSGNIPPDSALSEWQIMAAEVPNKIVAAQSNNLDANVGGAIETTSAFCSRTVLMIKAGQNFLGGVAASDTDITIHETSSNLIMGSTIKNGAGTYSTTWTGNPDAAFHYWTAAGIIGILSSPILLMFRFMGVPDKVYTVTVTYQKDVVQMSSASDDWGVIPDQYSDIYNNLFLAEVFQLSNDDRSAEYRVRGVAALLSKSQGLSSMQKSAFLEQYLARDSQAVAKKSRMQQGENGRGV